MSFLARLFGKGQESEILCPHCERAMDAQHDVERCARKRMSRRFFLGALGGAAVAVALPMPGLADYTVTIETGPSYVGGNQLLTPQIISNECLRILQSNVRLARAVQSEYNRMMSGQVESLRFGPRTIRIN